MTLTLGLGGVRRHSCAALYEGESLLAACEQERVTRFRAAGVNSSGLPDEALDFMLSRLGRTREQVGRLAVAEPVDSSPLGPLSNVVCFDHHLGHAAASYFTSPFDRAVVLVCDHQDPGVSVWEGTGSRLVRMDRPWRGIGLASLYSACAEALGFTGDGQASHLEALARLQPDSRDQTVVDAFRLDESSIALKTDWQAPIAAAGVTRLLASGRMDRAASIAGAVQNQIGDLLIELVTDVRRRTTATHVCLAGSLFYNTHFCTRVKTAGVFENVFVPVNPGNAGLAIGNALLANGVAPRAITPFLGPVFDSEEIKATLDNCKLIYEWVGEHTAAARAVDALSRGSLVGWYHGPMESGPRALGARCILASPFSPYVLENLNRFLKQRKPWRGYALSGLDEDVHQCFDGPSESPFMECDFRPRDRDLFRHVVPQSTAAIRVQTVGADAPPAFRELLRLFGQASGKSVLVNTSFNGFSEPIVCSPRDAIRVFYGTGLDMLVMNDFVITK